MGSRRRNFGDVETVRPDPVAWAEATAIVDAQDGDRRRIEVVSERTLVVRNFPVRG